MIVSIIVTLAGLGVACMGMKCTNCGGDDKVRKSRTAMGGGIIILIGGKEQSDLVVFNFYLFIFKRLTEWIMLLCILPQLCVPLLPALGMRMTSSGPSTTLSPLSTLSMYITISNWPLCTLNIESSWHSSSVWLTNFFFFLGMSLVLPSSLPGLVRSWPLWEAAFCQQAVQKAKGVKVDQSIPSPTPDPVVATRIMYEQERSWFEAEGTL